jgi:hypothetical protein
VRAGIARLPPDIPTSEQRRRIIMAVSASYEVGADYYWPQK